ncbi:unnamed protein product [Cladocopium goreaui]|uniref:Uncharacterized protein n=1 Tax=Cladocopium goreaui TaxID=2562237 RepID=A0A9P1FFQ9_9DINO|nr:unnamed protein product [Cladocopium goreaui]CAI4017838.1 unnamed protein product [Cladocopium goreaui]
MAHWAVKTDEELDMLCLRMMLLRAFGLCEFFAGDGHVGRSAKFAYYSTAQLDINYGKMTVRKGKQNSFDMTTAAGLALCIWVLLNANPSGFLALFAVVCTSFSAINVGTSKRTPATPWGNCALPHVQVGNCLLSRVVLLQYLVTCLGGTWATEQPSSSRLPWYPRWEEFMLRVRAWRVGWWARHYGALSPQLAITKTSKFSVV